MEGLSFRTIILNVFFQLVIFLYLMDNDTSWMILISNGIGLVIEIWKIQKAVYVKVSLGCGASNKTRRSVEVSTQPKDTFPFVQFIDRVKPSKLVSKTKKYDEVRTTIDGVRCQMIH